MTKLQFIPARPDELQLDLDGQDWSTHYDNPLGHQLGPRSYRRSRSGNWHCRIFMKQPLGPMQRICLQAGLGSDPVRERLSAERVRAGAPHPILFLEVEK